jgi:hypothetical protein
MQKDYDTIASWMNKSKLWMSSTMTQIMQAQMDLMYSTNEWH